MKYSFIIFFIITKNCDSYLYTFYKKNKGPWIGGKREKVIPPKNYHKSVWKFNNNSFNNTNNTIK